MKMGEITYEKQRCEIYNINGGVSGASYCLPEPFGKSGADGYGKPGKLRACCGDASFLILIHVFNILFNG